MASTVLHYRKVIGNLGYRFTLPILGAPTPAGESVDVEVAIFIKEPTKALHDQQRPAHPAARRTVSEDLVTVDVVVAGATWSLPLLGAQGGRDVEYHTVTTRRFPPSASAIGTSSLTSGVGTVGVPTGQGAGSGENSQDDRLTGRALISHQPSAPASLAAFDVIHIEPKASLDENLRINVAYHNQITRTRYVDVLPKGDDPLETPARVDPRLYDSIFWSVSVQAHTWFRQTEVSTAERTADWNQLVHTGLPCRVTRRHIDVLGRGCRADGLEAILLFLTDGEARLRLVAFEAPQAPQLATASAHASHILNNYQIVIEQHGRVRAVFGPVPLNGKWDAFLRQLAEYSSIQTGRSLIYSEEPGTGILTDRAAEIGFGVRLRDGGARLLLQRKRNGDGVLQLKLPGQSEYSGEYLQQRYNARASTW